MPRYLLREPSRMAKNRRKNLSFQQKSIEFAGEQGLDYNMEQQDIDRSLEQELNSYYLSVAIAEMNQ